MPVEKVLIARHQGGYGDIIACEVAVRAARTRFPNAHITWAVDDPWFPAFFDQVRSRYPSAGPDEVIWPDPWDEVMGPLKEKADIFFELDGPEIRHQLKTDYNLTDSRIESWVKYVDCYPPDMSPQWFSEPNERHKVISWLSQADIKPFNFILIQWCAAERKKSYPHTQELIELLMKHKLPVVVCHNGGLPNLGVFEAASWPFRELNCLAQLAAIAVGPDSFLQHLAAAVRTPSLGVFGPTNPRVYLKHYPLARFLWQTDVSHKDCEKTFPCFGIRKRNYWCVTRPECHSYCLEKLDPEVVVEAIYTYLNELEGRGFYKAKANSLSSGESSLFYYPDPRINLETLHHIRSERPVCQDVRDPVSVQREPC